MMLKRVAGSLAVLFILPSLAAAASGGWGDQTRLKPSAGSVTRLPPRPSPTASPVSPGVAHAPTPAPAPAGAPDDAAEEIIRARAEMQKAYDSINAVNPLSSGYGKAAPGAAPVTPPGGPMGDLYRLLSNPAIQGYLKLFSNPTFYQGAEQIMNHPRRMELLYFEVGFFLLMLLFRSWRMSHAVKWYHKAWTYVWTWVAYWVLAFTLLPWAVLGDAYYRLITGALGVWFK